MNPERIIAGLDIGSAKTTVVIAEAVGDRKNTPTLKILGVGQARTTGLRRGIVSDIEETTRSIKKAIDDAERMAGTKVDALYAGIRLTHEFERTRSRLIEMQSRDYLAAAHRA